MEVGEEFHVSEGSLGKFTERVIEALLDHEDEFVFWPNEAERRYISAWFEREKGIPGGCVGVVDGCHIVFYSAPAREDKQDYYSYKRRYRFSICAICDHNYLLRQVLYGFTASQHDTTVFESTKVAKYPEKFFSTNEFLLADSAYTPSKYTVPLFKCEKGNPNLERDEQLFNTSLAKARVAIEHAFGILKGRWQSLRGLRVMIRDKEDEARATCWIRACVLLHNMLITSSAWVVNEMVHKERALAQANDPEENEGGEVEETLTHAACGDETWRLRLMRDMGLDTANQLRIIEDRKQKAAQYRRARRRVSNA
ncbi:hypothetical protein I316_02294 [Kwoniella heveanensis BCC8398]|uniref:DDE Tnp4 domain-containing protein n=1 Tax=Kwoniella heveanensis BCC8398 TaxID=1296120 RepID=A0A1B9GXN6_9TREE|nr:hypothetical protein I316_02294 [Kwoniella heveanensis BCC8398]